MSLYRDHLQKRWHSRIRSKLIFLVLLLGFIQQTDAACGTTGKDCSLNGKCAFSTDTFSFGCECLLGFRGDGVNCTDVDECLEKTDDCDNLGFCTNTEGGFTCSNCPQGYQDVTGDGKQCKEIDECENSPCKGDSSTCINTDGSFECKCPDGWSGDGITFCADGQACPDSSNICPMYSECKYDAIDNEWACSCQSGFQRQGDQCVAGTLCPDINNICSENSKCIFRPAGFRCDCKEGFTEDGNGVCIDVDECTLGTNNCDSNAKCLNTDGSFACSCNSGFAGNGVLCTSSNETQAQTTTSTVTVNLPSTALPTISISSESSSSTSTFSKTTSPTTTTVTQFTTTPSTSSSSTRPLGRLATLPAEITTKSVDTSTESCPADILALTSENSEMAELDITLFGFKQQLRLPAGSYHFSFAIKDLHCHQNILVKDHRVVRRLEFKSSYRVSCNMLQNKIVDATLPSIAASRFNKIKEVCGNDCGPISGSKVRIECLNDIMRITWPTDVTYNATVTELPIQLKQRLTKRLVVESQYPILDVVVFTLTPPTLYPIKKDSGVYADIVSSSCLEKKVYDIGTDSCF